ncbi:ABC transporter ATP-binding protein [Natrinema halophilum]|uniref:ABC transporter ATP-binding protein n=1 Tax=Natrinema halophilum TaxID=1699371 RepID=A0A7D5H654_9EURY|nr:ABC transporter ATP-binding protein [Natrinema halophilum]QLG48495.1 ABC transporter ATP-binding protein [Natrinema halophilum]
MIELEDVNSGYDENQVLNDLSLTFEDGRVNCIIGPNGSGKSTTLKTINGLVSCWSGTIRHNDTEIQDCDSQEIVKRGIVTVPQGSSVFPEMTVKENLRMGAYLTDDDDVLDERYEYVFDTFPRVEERLSQQAGSMSGGEQAMVAMGRALMADPDFLLLDEPSAGLAPNLVTEIFTHLERLKEEGIDMVIVEQNVREVLNIAEHVFLLEQGQLEFSGRPSELEDEDELVEMYLGERTL